MRITLVVMLIGGLALGSAGAAGGVPDARGRIRLLEVAAGRQGEAIARLRARGLPVLAVLPDGLLVAASDEAVVGIGTDRGWSAEDAVTPGLAAALESKAQRPLSLVVRLARADTVERVAAAIVAAGGEVRWSVGGGRPELGVRAPAAVRAEVVVAAAADSATAWVSLQAGARLANWASVWRCQSGEPGRTPVFDHGLTGQGEVIAIVDTGLDADHCAFRDDVVGLPAVNQGLATAVSVAHRKVLAVDFLWDADWPPMRTRWDDYGHGTLVAGCAAGDVGADGVFEGVDGMAPAARLVIQDAGVGFDACADLPGLGCPVRPLEPVLEQAFAQGARIHNLSWGDAEEADILNRYTDRTGDVDRYLWTHPNSVVTAAAGNAGGAGIDAVVSPSTGKNVISVGATDHGDSEPLCPAGFSSRGWAADGRIKPDVLAPGAGIVSSASDAIIDSDNCDTTQGTGTSFSSPTVAGLVALVRQYFADGFYPTGRAQSAHGFEPSGALVKAMLIASAVDLAPGCPGISPVPSRAQGWGLVELEWALVFAGDSKRLLVVDSRGGFSGAGDPPGELTVVAGGGALTAVLVWYDPPSNPLAATNLINDLDLELVGPGGRYRGNVLVDGASVVGGDADRLNTVEVVKREAIEPGEWTVRVRAHQLPLPPQGYALVVVGDLRERPRGATGRVTPG